MVQRGHDVFAVDGSQELEKWVHWRRRHTAQKATLSSGGDSAHVSNREGLEPTLLGEERKKIAVDSSRASSRNADAAASGGSQAVKAM